MSQILEISDERLEELSRRIKPVVRMARVRTSKRSELELHEDGDLYFIKKVNPRNIAFIWNSKPTRRARGLNPYKTIMTIHNYGAPVFFKPSIAEVLAQIPEKDLGRCVAFETESDNGFTKDSRYHTAVTRLYEKK